MSKKAKLTIFTSSEFAKLKLLISMLFPNVMLCIIIQIYTKSNFVNSNNKAVYNIRRFILVIQIMT